MLHRGLHPPRPSSRQMKPLIVTNRKNFARIHLKTMTHNSDICPRLPPPGSVYSHQGLAPQSQAPALSANGVLRNRSHLLHLQNSLVPQARALPSRVAPPLARCTKACLVSLRRSSKRCHTSCQPRAFTNRTRAGVSACQILFPSPQSSQRFIPKIVCLGPSTKKNLPNHRIRGETLKRILRLELRHVKFLRKTTSEEGTRLSQERA